jgi:dolichyl-phosphate-mannose-protein mannosyltransferase
MIQHMQAIKRFFSQELVLLALLLIFGLVTHLHLFGHPREIVFDEVYFAQFVSHYFSGTYYFDIHPPLAKLIMAGAAQLLGFSPDPAFQFSQIGAVYTNDFYLLLRGMVSLAGILLPLAVYFLSKELFRNKIAAFIAGLLVVLDNALLVQSRYILTDAFMLLFGVAGLACVLASHRMHEAGRTRWRWTLMSLGALLLGACIGVKWTGLVFVGVAGIALLIRAFKKRAWLGFSAETGIMGTGIALIYILAFITHINALPLSGPGDAFMSPSFQKTLRENRFETNMTIKPASLPEKIAELNTVMYTANKGITATHPYGSSWDSWPFMTRPIYYWTSGTQPEGMSRIYLLGNPAIWWIGAVLIAYLSIRWIIEFPKRRKKEDFLALSLILAGFWANLLPYLFISRVAFLYHYFPSLLFLIIAIGYYLGRDARKRPYRTAIAGLLILWCFIYFAPLSYGTPLSDEQYRSRVWFSAWE